MSTYLAKLQLGSFITVYCNTVLHMACQWQVQGIDHTFKSQKTLHSSPSRASYGVSFVSIFFLGKWMCHKEVWLYLFSFYSEQYILDIPWSFLKRTQENSVYTAHKHTPRTMNMVWFMFCFGLVSTDFNHILQTSMSENFIPHFIMGVINYPCWESS